jgi:transcriptional regulator with XRE-family HTH domain
MTKIELGNVIRDARVEKGLTLRDLCKLSNVGRSTIGHVELGNILPGEEIFYKILKTLELEKEDFKDAYETMNKERGKKKLKKLNNGEKIHIIKKNNNEKSSEFGKMLSKLRTDANLTTTKLGQLMSINHTTIYKWEIGVSFPREIKYIEQLEAFFELKNSELFNAYVADKQVLAIEGINKQKDIYKEIEQETKKDNLLLEFDKVKEENEVLKGALETLQKEVAWIKDLKVLMSNLSA